VTELAKLRSAINKRSKARVPRLPRQRSQLSLTVEDYWAMGSDCPVWAQKAWSDAHGGRPFIESYARRAPESATPAQVHAATGAGQVSGGGGFSVAEELHDLMSNGLLPWSR
jgi:hypothetical protein